MQTHAQRVQQRKQQRINNFGRYNLNSIWRAQIQIEINQTDIAHNSQSEIKRFSIFGNTHECLHECIRVYSSLCECVCRLFIYFGACACAASESAAGKMYHKLQL